MSDIVKEGVAGLRRRILHTKFSDKPYPHLIVEPALDKKYYDELVGSFPDNDLVYQGNEPKNNYAHLLSASDILAKDNIGALWGKTVRELATPDFFRDALTAIAPHTKETLPDVEDRIGKSLNDCSLALRGSGQRADLYFDVQIGVNSPVTEISRVREVHVDKRVKIFNALLYMRDPKDNSKGGNLAIYEWNGPRIYMDDGVTVEDKYVKEIAQVEYTGNKLFLFQNSPDSLHGVTPRSVTRFPRRYINLLLVAGANLFETNGAKTSSKSSLADLGRRVLNRLAAR